MKNYEAKMTYLIRKQHGKCPIALESGKFEFPTELHHRVHNTKVNRKLYPLFLNSVWNLYAVDHAHHIMRPAFGKISYREAAKREEFLGRHPIISKAVNMKESDDL